MRDNTITVAVPSGSKLSSEDRPGRIESLPKGHMLTMGTVHAQRLAEELDREANPWGEPGEIPGEQGAFWISGMDGTSYPLSAVFAEGQFRVSIPGEAPVWLDADSPLLAGCRFRSRWTPEAPR